jgi:hypothetical protein
MPYIQEERAQRIQDGTVSPADLTAGDLNFLLTMTALTWLSAKPRNYDSLNAVIGALEACKSEFYRRLVAAYEESKLRTNSGAIDPYEMFFQANERRIQVASPEIEIAK